MCSSHSSRKIWKRCWYSWSPGCILVAASLAGVVVVPFRDPESLHHLLQRPPERHELRRGSIGLLRPRNRLSHPLIDRPHGVGYLVRPDRLLPRRQRYLLHRAHRLLDRLGHSLQRLARLEDLLHSFLHSLVPLLHRLDGRLGGRLDLLDDRSYLLGRFLALVGELSHFRGDHGEPLAVLARPRRFDGGV